jgi:hypothetical protein
MNADDRSPMLSQPSDDNAQGDLSPMISGRGTKVIADARGAYLAGNLDTLIAKMDKGQQLSFRQALVQQALYYLRYYMPRYDHPLRICIPILERWVENPSSEILHQLELAVYSQGEFQDFGFDDGERNVAPLDMWSGILGQFEWALRASTIHELADTIRMIPGGIEWYQMHFHGIEVEDEVGWESRRWQVEAAWAIIQRRNIISPEDFVTGIDETKLAYRRGQLDKLVALMSKDQRHDLCWHYLSQALSTAQGISPSVPCEPKLLISLGHYKHTVKRLGALTAQTLVLNELHGFTEEIHASTLKPFQALNASKPLDVAQWTMDMIVSLIHRHQEVSFDSSEMRQALRYWYLDAASAILEGKKPPPFEVTT